MATKKKNGTTKKPPVKNTEKTSEPAKTEQAPPPAPKKTRISRPRSVQKIQVDVMYRGKPTKADMFEGTHNGISEVFTTRKEGENWIKEQRTTNKTPTYAKVCCTHFAAWTKMSENVPEEKLEFVDVIQTALAGLAEPYIKLIAENTDSTIDAATDSAAEAPPNNPLSRLGITG